MCRLEGETHPRHWLELYGSHTPYEWAMQRAMSIVEPFGEDRADTRAKLNTLAIVMADIKPEEFAAVYEMLDNYTGDEEPTNELKADADALAKLKEKNGG